MSILKKTGHYVCWLVGKTVLKFFFRFEVHGKENLENQKSPLIVAFNHVSWLDPIFVYAAVPLNSKVTPIHFAAYYKVYRMFFPIFTMAGAFPVKRGVGLEKTLAKGITILKKGGTVGIAPEGKRRHLGRRRKGRRGAAFLALKTNTLILPVYIQGALGFKVLEMLLRKNKITVKFGKPFGLPVQSAKARPDLIKYSNFIMDKIYQLRHA